MTGHNPCPPALVTLSGRSARARDPARPVADALLELLELGKRPSVARDQMVSPSSVDLEDSFVAGPEGDFGELALEGDEKLLGHPRRAEEPAAAGTVRDLDARHAERARATA